MFISNLHLIPNLCTIIQYFFRYLARKAKMAKDHNSVKILMNLPKIESGTQIFKPNIKAID